MVGHFSWWEVDKEFWFSIWLFVIKWDVFAKTGAYISVCLVFWINCRHFRLTGFGFFVCAWRVSKRQVNCIRECWISSIWILKYSIWPFKSSNCSLVTCFTLAVFFLVSANIQMVNMALAILSDLVRTSTTGLLPNKRPLLCCLLMTHFRSETKSMSFSSRIFVKKSVNCYKIGNTCLIPSSF